MPVYIEHYMRQRYPGIAADLLRWQAYYLAQRPAQNSAPEHMLQQSLELSAKAFSSTEALMAALKNRYRELSGKVYLQALEPVFYRGWIGVDIPILALRMSSLKEEVENVTGDDESPGLSDVLDPGNVNIDELRQGDTQNAMAQFLTDLEGKLPRFAHWLHLHVSKALEEPFGGTLEEPFPRNPSRNPSQG